MCCSKFILFTSNTIIFLLGIVIVTLSSIVINRGSEYGSLFLNGEMTLPILLLIIGLVICIIGFLGCFGALRESKCMLYTYSMIVLLLFIGEIVLAALIIANPEGAKKKLEEGFNSQFSQYNTNDPALTKTIDNMQMNLQCCGVNGYQDWSQNNWNGGDIPWSCCSDNPSQSTCKQGILIGSDSINSVGCLDAFIADVKSITWALGISGIILAVFLFFSMSTACGLARKNNYS